MGPRILVTGITSAAGRAVAAQLEARGLPYLGTDAAAVNRSGAAAGPPQQKKPRKRAVATT